MKLKAVAYSLLTTLTLAGGVAQAATTIVNGGTVHFTGEIVEAACAVSTDSADQTVPLGQYRTTEFSAAGDTTTSKPFNIVLHNCDTTVANEASVAFTGQTDAKDATLLATSAGDNGTAATGVGIEILDNQSSTLKPDGQTYSAAQTLNDGTNTIPFAARYKATTATVAAGQANADATFVMKYE